MSLEKCYLGFLNFQTWLCQAFFKFDLKHCMYYVVIYICMYVHCIFDTEPRTVQQANCFLCVLVTASEPYLAYSLYAELFTSSTN